MHASECFIKPGCIFVVFNILTNYIYFIYYIYGHILNYTTALTIATFTMMSFISWGTAYANNDQRLNHYYSSYKSHFHIFRNKICVFSFLAPFFFYGKPTIPRLCTPNKWNNQYLSTEQIKYDRISSLFFFMLLLPLVLLLLNGHNGRKWNESR